MYEKTQAVVLHVTRHTDNLSILHLYTERFGRADCMVNLGRSKRTTTQAALLEPFSVIDVELQQRSAQSPQRLVSAKLAFVPQRIPFDMGRRCIALFLAEVLYRTLRRPLADTDLFDFLVQSVSVLDSASDWANVHLVFLMELSRHLGFAPNLNGHGDYLDMENGVRCAIKPLHLHFVEADTLQKMMRLAAADYACMDTLSFDRSARQRLLRTLEEYYKLHVPDFYGTRSLDVLCDLFE